MEFGNTNKRGLRRIRLVIDVINTVLSILTIGVTVFTFVRLKDYAYMFPYIFYMGATVNVLAGIKHMISERVPRGISCFIFAVLLIIVGKLTGVAGVIF